MDIEELVRKYYDAWDRQNVTMTEALEAVLKEQAAWYEQKIAFAEDAAVKGSLARSLADGMTMEIAELKERIRQLEAERVPSPSCRECANSGRVNGLSQETYCDSCVWQGRGFRANHYASLAKKEGSK